MKNYNIVVNSYIVKFILGQNFKLFESLRKSLGNFIIECFRDKIIICLEEE